MLFTISRKNFSGNFYFAIDNQKQMCYNENSELSDNGFWH